jgi:hypothetical protein
MYNATSAKPTQMSVYSSWMNKDEWCTKSVDMCCSSSGEMSGMQYLTGETTFNDCSLWLVNTTVWPRIQEDTNFNCLLTVNNLGFANIADKVIKFPNHSMQTKMIKYELMWTNWCWLTLSSKLLPKWNFVSKRKTSAKIPTTSTENTDLKTIYDWICAGRTFSFSKKYLCERIITDRSEPGNGTHHPPTSSFLNKDLKVHHNH